MAYQPDFAVSFKDATNWYTARILEDATYLITPCPTIGPGSEKFLLFLSAGWDKNSIVFERDMTLKGVFRSTSTKNFQFNLDARAILQSIYKAQGKQGDLIFTIWQFDEVAFHYKVWYKSNLDFSSYSDDLFDEIVTISTIDNGLIRDYHAYASTQYNIPFFTNTGTDDAPIWSDPDVKYVLHDGIKLLYEADYISNANPDTGVALDYDTTPLLTFDAPSGTNI